MKTRNRILVVEDDRDTLLGLSIVLNKNGYEVIRAEDGTMALQIASREKPDLILLDLGLPAGDGFFVLESLRNSISLLGIPVIVTSARDAASNKQRALDAGAQGYLEKPVEISELLTLIEGELVIPEPTNDNENSRKAVSVTNGADSKKIWS